MICTTKKRYITLSVILLFLLSVKTYSQDSIHTVNKKYWSVETSLVWPIFPGIFKLNFVRQVWKKKNLAGEVGFGLNIQPERTHPTEGAFSEEFITLFYRQYFWKGLHIQVENNFAYGRIRNFPGNPGMHESYAIFHDFTLGYRFILLKKHKVALTLNPHGGGGFTSYVNASWPREEKPYWLLNLLAGIHF